jgi:hypothetical protein
MGWAVNVTPLHFIPKKKTWYQSCRRLSGPQSQAERIQIILPPLRLDLCTVQPIASFYTDYTIPANIQYCIEIHLSFSLISSSLFEIFLFKKSLYFRYLRTAFSISQAHSTLQRLINHKQIPDDISHILLHNQHQTLCAVLILEWHYFST